MNSGLTAIPSGANEVPPVPLARAGSRTRSVVPGTTALRRTSCPAAARHALVTQPTYPSPNTLTRILDPSSRSHRARLARALRAPLNSRLVPAPLGTPRVPLRRHAGGGGERRVDAVGG